MIEKRKYIVDTTLRDGEQAPGVVFFKPEKLEIAAALDKMGIDELEIGTPAMGDEEVRDMQAIVALNPAFKTIAWCRAVKHDIDEAYRSGVDAVNISFPVSFLHLMAMDKSVEWVLETMEEMIPYAKSLFACVYVGAQDASRADSEFLNRFVDKALKLGVNRIRIADTVGILNPVSVADLFTKLSTRFPETDFEFHPHNDLGMATANALTALQNGASGVSCTVNGLGERAGNAALEELIVAMTQSAQMESRYDLSGINALSKKVETFSGYQLQASKAIVGENAFSHETGIHTRCLLSNKLTYQPFDERIVGKQSNKIVFGKHSGKASIERFFSDKGIVLNALQIMMIMNQLKELALRTKSAISDHHLLRVYHSIVS